MAERARAWSLLSVGEDRQYGGNFGYADEVGRVYRYDSQVANSKQVSAGDVVVLRDRDRALGIATVEDIEAAPGHKHVQRCPSCGKSNVKLRKRREPPWRCGTCAAEFEEPSHETVAVTEYAAAFGATYLPVQGLISAAALKRAAMRPGDQMSMEELDPSRLDLAGAENEIDIRARLAEVFFRDYDLDDRVEGTAPDGEEQSGVYVSWPPPGAQERERALRAIAVRRGQPRFRRRLIQRFRGQCAITGCDVVETLEAAHISPYRSGEDNHPSNGLLLRADLHTLFDLDLLGVDPVTLRVHLHPALRNGELSMLHGTRLRSPQGRTPSGTALERRWREFGLRCKKERR